MSLIPAKAYDLYYELGRRDIHLSITADGQSLATDKHAKINDLVPEILRLENWIVEIVKSRQGRGVNAKAKIHATPQAPSSDATPLSACAVRALTSLQDRLGCCTAKAIEVAAARNEATAKANDYTAYFWDCLTDGERREMAILRVFRECEEWRAPVEAPKPLPREIRKPAKLYARPYPMPNGGG